jgi:hypothetical protein
MVNSYGARACDRAYDLEMDTNRPRAKRRGVKFGGAVLAGAAVAVAGALTVAFDGDGSGHANVLAGSGHGDPSTTFRQPAEPAMNLGATATATTPPSAPLVADASPALKAG